VNDQTPWNPNTPTGNVANARSVSRGNAERVARPAVYEFGLAAWQLSRHEYLIEGSAP
jgi:hypothetical protein